MGSMTVGSDWQRLAAHVRDRRTDLGLTQEDVRFAGGPSVATVRNIEGGAHPSYRPAILRSFVPRSEQAALSAPRLQRYRALYQAEKGTRG